MGGRDGKQIGVKGCINKTNITKYSRRHLSYFLCPTALPCPPGRGLCSLFLRAVHPIRRSSCDQSLLLKKSIRWEYAALCMVMYVCVFWCVPMLV